MKLSIYLVLLLDWLFVSFVLKHCNVFNQLSNTSQISCSLSPSPFPSLSLLATECSYRMQQNTIQVINETSRRTSVHHDPEPHRHQASRLTAKLGRLKHLTCLCFLFELKLTTQCRHPTQDRFSTVTRVFVFFRHGKKVHGDAKIVMYLAANRYVGITLN